MGKWNEMISTIRKYGTLCLHWDSRKYVNSTIHINPSMKLLLMERIANGVNVSIVRLIRKSLKVADIGVLFNNIDGILVLEALAREA